MRHKTTIAAVAALALAVPVTASAESFLPSAEDTGMSFRALKNEVYDTYRSNYLYPGGDVPSTAYSAPGIVYGGGPVVVQPYPYGARAYGPDTRVYYPPYPPGY